MIRLTLLFLFTLSAHADIGAVPTLETKQDVRNIRFISEDGKTTYFQRRSGDLILSANFASHVLLEGGQYTEYNIQSFQKNAKIIIQQFLQRHLHNNSRQEANIYISDFGSQKLTNVGQGILPRLSLDGQWVLFYKPFTQTIWIQSLVSQGISHKIKMSNPINPYYWPDFFMRSPEEVVYTDLNKEGKVALLKANLLNKKTDIIYNSKKVFTKLELCTSSQTLYWGEFPLQNLDQGSVIWQMPLSSFDDSKKEEIYSSPNADLGQILCDFDSEKLYFIGLDQEPDTQRLLQVLKEVDLKTKKASSDMRLKHLSQIIQMAGKIIAPLNGRFYVMKGRNDFSKDQLE